VRPDDDDVAQLDQPDPEAVYRNDVEIVPCANTDIQSRRQQK
jgi:hypothetical protein